MPTIGDLALACGLIFSGTVVQHGASTVPDVPPAPNLIVVRVEHALRADPVLGDLSGKMITVAAVAPEQPRVGEKAIFFTQSWVHGRGIAAREVAHIDAREEKEVAAAVAQLPQLHMRDRLQNAQVVVEAEVTVVRPIKPTMPERNAALWGAAELKIARVLRGRPIASAVVYFPTSNHPMWMRAPRFRPGQRGVFILHAPSRANPSEASLPPNSLVALDPEDYQPEAQLADVQKMLGSIP